MCMRVCVCLCVCLCVCVSVCLCVCVCVRVCVCVSQPQLMCFCSNFNQKFCDQGLIKNYIWLHVFLSKDIRATNVLPTR
jgi:hypothetical protein